jgi:uncharacterized membrane protein
MISGIVEIALGICILLMPKKTVPLGWIVAAYFVLIFPGNISQYVNQKDALGLDTDKLRMYRLFLQPILMAWSLWASGAWDNLIHTQGNWPNKDGKSESNSNKQSKQNGHAKIS